MVHEFAAGLARLLIRLISLVFDFFLLNLLHLFLLARLFKLLLELLNMPLPLQKTLLQLSVLFECIFLDLLHRPQLYWLKLRVVVGHILRISLSACTLESQRRLARHAREVISLLRRGGNTNPLSRGSTCLRCRWNSNLQCRRNTNTSYLIVLTKECGNSFAIIILIHVSKIQLN